MKKKLILFLVAALATCGTAGVLSACSNGSPGSQVYNPGDTIVEEREGEFTYDQDGNLIGTKFTGKKITVKYLVSESAYVTLAGEKANEMYIDGYSGDITELSVSDIENNVAVGNVKVSVAGITDGAFYGCETLEKADLTKTNASLSFAVGNSAFANCVALESVVLPEDNIYTVSSVIGSRAFENNTALTSLELGNKLVGIGSSAFHNCIALTSVTIPENVTVINSRTFADCDQLASINVSANAKLKSIQDRAFTNTGINSLNLSNLTELRYIGESAFSATQLSSVNLPDSVSYVGNKAFYNCNNLSTVNVPFLGNSIVRSNTFTSIYGVDGDDERNLNITVKSAASVPAYSFANMENIVSLNISSFAKEGAYRIYDADGVTFNRVNLTEEEVINGDSVQINKLIGERAFNGCEKLSNLVLPSDTEGVGRYAFNGCAVLSSFTIPASVKTIGEGAFNDCKAFTSMTIPALVTVVGEGAFNGCNNLTTLTIERLNGVQPVYGVNKRIKGYEYVSLSSVSDWFASNNNLGTINVNSLYTLPDNAFSGLNSLAKVSLTFKAIDETPFDADENANGGYLRPSDIPEHASLGNGAFRNCVMFNELTINDTDKIVENIGDNTFENCEMLASFNVPASVKTIGSEAFKGCTSFKAFTVPASVYSVGNGAFTGCLSLNSFTIEAYNQIVSEFQMFGNVETYKSIGNVSSLFGNMVPESIKTVTLKGVNRLADNSFSGWENLVNLKIEFTGTLHAGSGKDVTPYYTTIGAYAFDGCVSLNNVEITGGENVKSVQAYAFNDCKLITDSLITAFSNVAEIGEKAFAGCTMLHTVTLTGTLLSIGNNAFYDCPNVQVINIGNYAAFGTKAISALFGADSSDDNYSNYYVNGVPVALETVTLNGLVDFSDLSSNVFNGLTNVKAIALNLSTDKTSLFIEESNPFAACTSLVKVFFNDSITEIYFGAGVSVWGDGGFELGGATVYTYREQLDAYGNFWHYDGTAIVKYGDDEYIANKYKFNLNGGVLPEDVVDAVEVDGPLTADKVPELTNEGFTFIGWYDNAEFNGYPVTFPYYSTGEAQLYAKWIEENKYVEKTNDFFNESSNSIDTRYTGVTSSNYARYEIEVWKPSKVTVTVGLSGATYRNGVLTVSVNKADGNNETVFTINNNSYSWDSEYLGSAEYRNTFKSKTITVNLATGDSLVIYYSKYNSTNTDNYAYAEYEIADKQTVSVTAPVIPETTIPTYDISDVVEQKGFEVGESVFANAIKTFNYLSQTTGFKASMEIFGISITETYDFANNRIEQVITYNGVTQTNYFVYDRYNTDYGFNGATVSYFKLTEEQLDVLRELAKQYQDEQIAEFIETLSGKWISTTVGSGNLITPDRNLTSISTDIKSYEFDAENGAYWKVINGSSDGVYKSVIVVTFDINGKAQIYLSLYRYNELYLTIKSYDFNNASVTLPQDISNAVDLSQLG